MMRTRTALIAAALALAPVGAIAQSTYPSVGGANVPTSVAMCLNSSGQAVPLFNAAGTWQCAGAAIPTTATLSGTGANNADAVPSVATGLSSADTYNFVYNGTTWDRARGDTTNGTWVNVKAMAALPTGANVVGKFGIDQTTPGTSNAVAATNLPAAVDTNSGNKSASTVRVVLATDQPALTSKLLVTPDSVALPANQSVNVAQINAVTPLMGNGATGTGSPRITIASDNTAFNVNALLNATPTDANGNGVVLNPSTEALAGIAPVVSAALESNHIICAAACNFYGGYITTGATAGWLLLANATSAPTAGGAAIAPIACVLAPANQTTSISGPPSAPIRGSTGIVMVFSTTGCLTNTASTTAFFSGQAK